MTWLRWVMRLGAVALGATGGAALASRQWFMGVWYVAISLTWALNAWSIPSSFERGRWAGRREARRELWASFHEAVVIRQMHPAQWLAAEAERDEPRIVAFLGSIHPEDE